MHRKKNPEQRRSSSSFWSFLLGPAVFAIWVVLYFQGEIRGASFTLQMLLLMPAAVSGWLLYLFRSFFQGIAEEYHQIAASALFGATFFAIWALGTIPMEEIFVLLDGYEGRRIYSDDSAMGYPIGPRNILTVTALALIGGMILGFACGVVTSIVRKIPRLANLTRSA